MSKYEKLLIFFKISLILLIKQRSKRTDNALVEAKKEAAIRIQIPVKQINDLILQVIIEIDDHVPANNQIKFNVE